MMKVVTDTPPIFFDPSSLHSSLQEEILWTVIGPKKILRLTAISSFSKQVAAFYEKRGFLSSASQSKAPSFLGLESMNENRSLTVANEENDARIRNWKAAHPQMLRKNYDVDQSYVDSADDNFHSMMAISQAHTDTSHANDAVVRERIERESKKIRIDKIDTVEADLGLDLNRYSYAVNASTVLMNFESNPPHGRHLQYRLIFFD